MIKDSQNSGDVQLVENFNQSVKQVKDEIRNVIIGQDIIIDNLLVSLFSKGHCLLIGVPGLAKTLLIKTIAEVFELEFNRIQFTPDLMPSDIIGTEILEENNLTKKRNFKFIKGPVFSNIILADEINRTPPKTQAALLEAMQEYRVTAAGNTYQLTEPFFVLATQNPIEQEGTYPLPEAQLDRFMFSLFLDYPGFDEEVEIIKSTTSEVNTTLKKFLSRDEIKKMQELVRRVPVADNVIKYAVRLVHNSRPGKSDLDFVNKWLSWGAGPRASQYLILAAKTNAILEGRFTPNIEDVNKFAVPVLRHRLIPNFSAEAEGVTTLEIIDQIINSIN